MKWEAALSKLKDGHARFCEGKKHDPDHAKYKELGEKGQKPFAIIISCADSRVPVEEIFDAGPGELFVIRVAGNVVQESQIASIEYAVANLGTSLCVFMGHAKCGAVGAAVDAHLNSSKLPTPSLQKLVDIIDPAVKACAAKTQDPGELLVSSIDENANLAIKNTLEMSPLLKEKVDAGDLKMEPGLFDIETAAVRIG